MLTASAMLGMTKLISPKERRYKIKNTYPQKGRAGNESSHSKLRGIGRCFKNSMPGFLQESNRWEFKYDPLPVF